MVELSGRGCRPPQLVTDLCSSTFAVQAPEVNFLLWRTAANQLVVLCSSSGWSSSPLVSVLDGTGSKVPTVGEPEVVVQPDGHFSVSVRVNLDAVNGNPSMLTTSLCVPALAVVLPLFFPTFRTKKQERDLSHGGPPSTPGQGADDLHHR